MGLFSRHEATGRYDTSWAGLDVKKREFIEEGSPELVDAQLHQAVLDSLSATEDLILSYQDHLYEKVHDADKLLPEETNDLVAMLTKVMDRFFPEPGVTLVDDPNSLEARVIRLMPSSTKLLQFRAALIDCRREVAILAEWFSWFSTETTHDPGGMFDAIRHQYELPQVFARQLGLAAEAFRKLRKDAMKPNSSP